MENRTRTQGLQASLLPHGRKAFPSTAGDEFPNGGKLFDVQVQSHKRAGAQMERESQGPLTRDGSGILAYPNLESKLPCLELVKESFRPTLALQLPVPSMWHTRRIRHH